MSHCRVAVGLHACREALKVRSEAVEELWLSSSKWSKSHGLKELAELAELSSVTIVEKKEGELSKFAESHQGAAAFISETPELLWASLEGKNPQLLLALDEVSDPHNLGAVMRTAWLMGVQGLFISQHRSSPLTPSVHKVACGAVEHIPVDASAPLVRRLSDLKKQDFWIFGLDGDSQRNVWGGNSLPEKLVLVVGSEGHGLRRSTKKVCDELISIPQKQVKASYNASVAAALGLSEYAKRYIF